MGFEFNVTLAKQTLLLEPYLRSILLWLFWRWDLKNFLPGLASNYSPPNFSFLSSEEYGHK
jgi:hypothetical protein